MSLVLILSFAIHTKSGKKMEDFNKFVFNNIV